MPLPEDELKRSFDVTRGRLAPTSAGEQAAAGHLYAALEQAEKAWQLYHRLDPTGGDPAKVNNTLEADDQRAAAHAADALVRLAQPFPGTRSGWWVPGDAFRCVIGISSMVPTVSCTSN